MTTTIKDIKDIYTLKSVPKKICPLCHHEEVCLYEAFPLLDLEEGRSHLVCQACSFFVNYAKTTPDFKTAAYNFRDILAKHAERLGDDDTWCYQINNPDDDRQQIQFAKGITHKIPHQNHLQYACGVVAFLFTIGSFNISPTLHIGKDAFLAGTSDHQKKIVGDLAISSLDCALKNQKHYTTFNITLDGTISAVVEVHSADKILIFFYKLILTRTEGLISLQDYSVSPRTKENQRMPWNFICAEDSNRIFAQETHDDETNETIIVSDSLWIKRNEAIEAEKQLKLAKKEKERKEKERKEKKEREREELRLLAIKQREEEKALRLARASLVEAVAKVDTELEKIRKLKELNAEVALKNKKIFERKEAERIARDAERRHAEKLKQKELERQQKFIAKKN